MILLKFLKNMFGSFAEIGIDKLTYSQPKYFIARSNITAIQNFSKSVILFINVYVSQQM